jgi:glucuronate isomerase
MGVFQFTEAFKFNDVKRFLDENFLLNSKTAERLYHEYASKMPIIDYHCHLPVEEIAADRQFENLTQVWLNGDHYKWRAMRANGISEAYITGGRSDWEKFEKWAETVPYTLRNPLYHWTHLELQRYFDVYEILSPATARKIYDECAAKLQTPEYSVRNLIRKMGVTTIATTDDPLDDLHFHQQISEEGFEVKILPAFRPDKAMEAGNIQALNLYIDRLEALSGEKIKTLANYFAALKRRHDHFAANGCMISDHGLEHMYAENFTVAEVQEIFMKIRSRGQLQSQEILQFKAAMLYEFALWDHEKGWVQQFHLGALRNNNTRLLRDLGPDTGLDSIGDFAQAKSLSCFLDRLDKTNQLTKTIIYNLNPADNEILATMIGNFNDGSASGKIQWGAAWWFLDQKEGMVRQINTLSNMGLLSRFIGMLTDSRSFLSFPRHEYFRRLLCDLFAEDVENGELPDDLEWIGQVIQDICYNNAKAYFNF